MKKICTKCGEAKGLRAFSSSRRDGAYSQCKTCLRLWGREHYKQTRDSVRGMNLRYLYGIDKTEYYRLLEKQNGRCAICGEAETAKVNGSVKSFAVDHNHNSGQVRGLLCQRCNAGIGSLRDDPDRLLKASNYLVGL